MSKKLSKFGAAFAAARKSDRKEFSFGGKKYNTKLKGEGTKKSSLPSKAPIPKSKASLAGMDTKQPSFSSLSQVGKEAKKSSAPVPIKSSRKVVGSGGPVGTGGSPVGTGKSVVGTGKRVSGSGDILFKKKK